MLSYNRQGKYQRLYDYLVRIAKANDMYWLGYHTGIACGAVLDVDKYSNEEYVRYTLLVGNIDNQRYEELLNEQATKH